MIVEIGVTVLEVVTVVVGVLVEVVYVVIGTVVVNVIVWMGVKVDLPVIV